MVTVVRGMVIDDDGKPMLGIPQEGEVGYDPDAYKTALTTFGTSIAPYMLGVPYAANEVYQGLTNNDLMRSGFGAVGGILGTVGGAKDVSQLPYTYAKTTMPLRNVTTNIEATAPKLLQKVEKDPRGLALSDLRFNTALDNALKKNIDMAKAPVKKTQGVWVDPSSNANEFNRVYTQNVGKTLSNKIQNDKNLAKFSKSMGKDLTQIGVGATRFSPIPLNANKNLSNAIKYNDVSSNQIIQAGKKLNPKGGVVSATPDGGMLVFDPSGKIKTTQMQDMLGFKKPQFGLIDSAYFDTKNLRQTNAMKDIDSLIKSLGY